MESCIQHIYSFKVICRLIIPLFFEFIAFLATNKYPFSIFRPSWKNTRRSVTNWRIMRAPSRLYMIKLTLLVKMTGKAEQVTFPFPFYWNLHYISTFFWREIFFFTVTERLNSIDKRYQELQELAKLRKQRLLDALSLYKLFTEADGVEQWINEKEKMLVTMVPGKFLLILIFFKL